MNMSHKQDTHRSDTQAGLLCIRHSIGIVLMVSLYTYCCEILVLTSDVKRGQNLETEARGQGQSFEVKAKVEAKDKVMSKRFSNDD